MFVCSRVEPPLRQLYELANTPFQSSWFWPVCTAFAVYHAGDSLDDLWEFVIAPDLRLLVHLEGKSEAEQAWREDAYRVTSAMLTFCWEETVRHDGEHTGFGGLKRKQLDAFFVRAVQRTTTVLGPALFQGKDTDAYEFQYALWRGDTGLLVLQQSNIDPIMGLDIHYWLQPWSGPDPQPTDPFLDWLLALDSGKAA